MGVQCAGILAAGDGARFQKAGWSTPKPLITVGGVPLIHRCLRLLEEAGIREVFCIINESGIAIQDSVRELAPGIPVRFLVQNTPSSMHSLFALAPQLEAAGRFLLTTVDAVAAPQEFLNYMDACRQEKGFDGILACTSYVQDENPLWIEVDEEHRILRFSAPEPESQCVTGGMYVLDSRVFDEMETARERGISRLRNFLGHLAGRGYSFRGFHFERIIDVDDPVDVAEAERFLQGIGEARHSL